MSQKVKLALLTNMIAPYRVPVYSVLADGFDLLVLNGGKEANRDSWNDDENVLPSAKVVRAWGWQFRYARKINGEVFDDKFIHITPGFLWHLLRFRPDAIISAEMGFRSLVALAYGAAFRKPTWIWWGGTLHSERSLSRWKRVLRKLFVLLGDRWVTYGHTSTEYLVHLGVNRERIFQSQNAVDDKRFSTDEPPAWTITPRPVVLHVGQFVERKGIGHLLNAAADLQQQGFEFSLLLVGSGRDKEVLERRAEALGLKHVHFHPPQPPERMPSVYRSADLFVFPTLEDVWGLVANEAVLSGLPVLCSTYAGCAPELFAPESVFSPDDQAEFREKLRAAIAGKLPAPDSARLKTASQVGTELTAEVNRFVHFSRPVRQAETQSIPR